MIIEVNNLKKSYKNDEVLKGITFKVREPNIIALVGPNGSGKTTLLDCMTNILQPDQGNVHLLGKESTDSSLFFEVSYFQDNRVLYEELTGRQHLEFICRIQKLPISEVDYVAKKVNIASYMNKKVKKYSLGMKQHLLLAIAIINQPKLLILDEPLNGMDPTSSINVRNLLLELHQMGTTILISSHNLDEIDRLTNDIFFMKDGKIIQESINDLEKEYYTISVHNMEKAKQVLNEDLDKVAFYDSYIQINTSKISLDSIIQKLVKHEIKIVDVNKKTIGAEKRYQELYGGV